TPKSGAAPSATPINASSSAPTPTPPSQFRTNAPPLQLPTLLRSVRPQTRRYALAPGGRASRGVVTFAAPVVISPAASKPSPPSSAPSRPPDHAQRPPPSLDQLMRIFGGQARIKSECLRS